LALSAGGRPDTLRRIDLPDTPAGRCAAAYLEAFNSGDDDRMRDFQQRYRTRSYLERTPIKDRLSFYRGVLEATETLTPIRVAHSTDREVILFAQASRTHGFVELQFNMDDTKPGKLVGFNIKGRVDRAVAEGALKPIDDEIINATIESVAGILRDSYIYPDKGEKMADTLRRHQSNGRYQGITNASKLASRLTDDLYAVCRDGHLAILARAAAQEQETSDSTEDSLRGVRHNYGFRKVELLPGNIGYVRFDAFHHSEEAQEIAAAALAFVANCKALILDLRQNDGGSPEMIRFISSYLFDKPTQLGGMYDRVDDETSESWTYTEIPGKRFDADLPVYVLTSVLTYSAAEAFTYDLKHLKRATIIGDTTGGGAHLVTRRAVGDQFKMRVPTARAVNPITKTNWEGVGVVPHIQVPASEALDAACKDAADKSNPQGARRGR
jgi:hypothetical protein